MGYKVVKNFGIVEKGDIFNNTDGMWVCDAEYTKDNFSSQRLMAIDDAAMSDAISKGLVEEIKEDKRYSENVENTLLFIDDLLSQYEDDHNEMLKKYNKQEIPICVKVEADTVYYNLSKVLNAVRDKLIA